MGLSLHRASKCFILAKCRFGTVCFWTTNGAMFFLKVHYMLLLTYIYIYAFSRCFYPKRLTVHSGYTFFLSVHASNATYLTSKYFRKHDFIIYSFYFDAFLPENNHIFSISVHTEQVFVFRNVIHNVKSFKGGHV